MSIECVYAFMSISGISTYTYRVSFKGLKNVCQQSLQRKCYDKETTEQSGDETG